MAREQHHNISTKEFISEKEYNEIKKLQDICYVNDQINLKLELDYKLMISNHAKQSNKTTSNQWNEFLYYIEDTLVAYIGISCFGGNIGEINGMTHPDWRRQGIFHKLFDLVVNECQRRSYTKILLLSDHNSESGITFIKSMGGIYDFSEYRMKRLSREIPIETSSISLRIAQKQDKEKIVMLNASFFHDEQEATKENENGYEDGVIIDDPNTTIFLITLDKEVIGKIHVEYDKASAFICGFGILLDYRKNGYGKAALNEVLRLIEEKNITQVGLDVVCSNRNALNLYISCGFQQQSIMNYYQFSLI